MNDGPRQAGAAPERHNSLVPPTGVDLSALDLSSSEPAQAAVRTVRTALNADKPAALVRLGAPTITAGLVERVASSEILCFDIDYTLNNARAKPISDAAAELLLEFILMKKKIRFISGRTFDDFKEIDTLAPLIKRLKERNIQTELGVYSTGGGEKIAVRNDGSFRSHDNYIKPISGWACREIVTALIRADMQLDRDHGLRGKGIKRAVRNYHNLVFKWSPYGNEERDVPEYDFETGGQQPHHPPRKTRKELAEEIVAALAQKGITDIEFTVSGKTTISFFSRGMTKERAMLDILQEGSATYFGDEVASRGDSTGNDNIVGKMAKRHASRLTVVALDEVKEGESYPEGVVHVGGLLDGTLLVLKEALNLCKDLAAAADSRLRTVRELLANYDLGDVKELSPLPSGRGIHNSFFLVKATTGQYILRHVRPDLYPDPLEAARHEVWAVRTLNENQVPFAPIVPKKESASGSSCPEDESISVAADGTCHLLYKFVDGEVGSHATTNPIRFDRMVALLAKAHRVMAEQICPYPRQYSEGTLLSIAGEMGNIRNLKDSIERKKTRDAAYVYTRAERLVLENADFIEQQLELCSRNLGSVYPELPKVTIHGDFHPPNVVFAEDEIVAVFDLERMRVEARVEDLAAMFRMDTQRGRFDVENAKRLIFAYHKHNPLWPEEIKALPEILRWKLLDRVCRITHPSRHYESRRFDFTGVADDERSLSMIDHDDSLFLWYQNLIMALRDLDGRVEYGDFRRQIQEPLEHDTASSRQVIERCRDRLKQEKPTHHIAIQELKSFSLAAMLKAARPIEDEFKENRGCWSRSGNYYSNSQDPNKAWCRLKSGERVVFYTDKAVAYQAVTGNIYLWVRGNDLDKVKENAEKAHIEIVLDEDGCAKAAHMLQASQRDLSRSSLAIQLTDSGIFDKFPILRDVLKYQLVWQEVDGGLRHRELLDSYDIRLDLLDRAMAFPEAVTGDEISSILHFRFFKTRVVRRKALAVLAQLHERGRISQAEYSFYVPRFLRQDIQEDFRVIERSVKNDPAFVRDLFHNLFGVCDVSLADLSSVDLEYYAQGPTEEVYLATFFPKNGPKKQAAMTLMRHDPINEEYGLTEDEINASISIWKRLSQAGMPGIVKFGSYTWEIDYRDKDIILGGQGARCIKEKFVNNVVVSCREFAHGQTLEHILKRADLSMEAKERAVEVCRALCAQLFHATIARLGKGYFIQKPEPRKFIMTDDNGELRAVLTETYRLVDYSSLEHLKGAFEQLLPPEFARNVPHFET